MSFDIPTGLSIREQGRLINQQYAAQKNRQAPSFKILEGRIRNGNLEFFVDAGAGIQQWVGMRIHIEVLSQSGEVLEAKKDNAAGKLQVRLPSHSHSVRCNVSWE